MRKIDENEHNEKYDVLIPAMLDMHFPLLKYAFFSKNYHPYILENEYDITNEGLKYVNNDMCYPCILNTGQIIEALKSGQFDISKTKVLMPTAGDACRGANYTGVLRRALAHAGFRSVQVLSLNVRGLEKNEQMKLNFDMVWRAFVSIYYGDILMILLYQTRPYEINKDEADRLWQKWIDILSEDFKSGKNLTLSKIKKNFIKIAQDFSEIKLNNTPKTKIGLIGELYIKYCHLGNLSMIDYLEKQGCECQVNGVTWYAIYYIDTHLAGEKGLTGLAYKIGKKFFESLQNSMIRTIRQYGFHSLDEFEVLKEKAAPYVNFNISTGDGWLIGAEAVNHIDQGFKKVLAMQPFGCMPNHVSGRGTYPSIERKLPGSQIISVDVDSGASSLNIYNRVEILIKH